MLAGQLEPGQQVASQPEDYFSCSQYLSGSPATPAGRLVASNIPIGSVAYGSLGTNTADVAGQWWITDILVPYRRAITGIGFLQGATATTDNFMVALYNSKGVLIANSATAGVVLSGASTFQQQALLVPTTNPSIYGGSTGLVLPGPAQYYVAIQGNGTAAGAIATVATLTYLECTGASLAGTFGTVPATITVPTTFTANKAPIVYLY